MHRVGLSGAFRYPCLVAACILLAAFLLACGGNDTDAAASEKMLLLEAKAHSLEESLEALHEENASTRSELAALEQEQADFMRERKEAETSEKHVEEVADSEEGQEEQLAALEEGLARADERFDGLETRLLDLEGIASQVDLVLPAIEKWFKGMDQRLALMEGTTLERTARLAEAAGGEVYYIDSREPEERAILVMPLEPIDGGPLIVSLHGYGGNSADHSLYIPLHERVNEAGFGLLLPNGTHDSQGNRSWNPTDQSSQSGKAGADDVAYLADLVARALEVKDFGPVYLFGYSNGGFMSYHMACKSLPGLRAVASLAGTSYVEDSSCDGAPPVSVLHIHGTNRRRDPVRGRCNRTGCEWRRGTGILRRRPGDVHSLGTARRLRPARTPPTLCDSGLGRKCARP